MEYTLLVILFSLYFLIDTLGYSVRLVGDELNMASLGYSLHTQFGTYARFLTMIAMPIVGYLIDTAKPPSFFLQLLLGICFIYTLGAMLIYIKLNISYEIIAKFFVIYSRRFYKLDFGNINRSTCCNLDVIGARFFISSFMSFFLVLIGMFVSIILAANFYDYRAMILQMSTISTALGTFISVAYFDPSIAILIDAKRANYKLLGVIILSRIYAVIAVAMIALLIELFAI